MPFSDFSIELSEEEIHADLFYPATALTRGDDGGATMTEEPFAVRIAVRAYELDSHGHVNRAVYVQYAEHARWEHLRAAGIDQADLLAAGVGPVTLEERIRYHRELRAGEEVAVSSTAVWGDGKTFGIEQEFRLADRAPIAAVSSVCGLLDLEKRRLVSRPAERLRSLARLPDRLGLS
jgi:acyl-CoA thioester hydrolase